MIANLKFSAVLIALFTTMAFGMEKTYDNNWLFVDYRIDGKLSKVQNKFYKFYNLCQLNQRNLQTPSDKGFLWKVDTLTIIVGPLTNIDGMFDNLYHFLDEEIKYVPHKNRLKIIFSFRRNSDAAAYEEFQFPEHDDWPAITEALGIKFSIIISDE